MTELLNCPFCGSADIAYETFDQDDSRDFVMCNGCGVYAQRNDCDADPVEVWSRRTPSASIGEDRLPELSDDLRRQVIQDTNDTLREQAATMLAQRKKIQQHEATIADFRARLAAKTTEADAWSERWLKARRLARQSQEPVAYMYVEDGETYFGHPDGYHPSDATALYAAPPLSSEQIMDAEIIDIMRPYMLEADGGYACDIAPDRVISGVRAVLRLISEQQAEKGDSNVG